MISVIDPHINHRIQFKVYPHNPGLTLLEIFSFTNTSTIDSFCKKTNLFALFELKH